MASAAAIQKRESAVLGKIQSELAFFVDRQSMSVGGNKNALVPKEFNLDNFQIVDGNIDFTPVCQTERCDEPQVATEEGPENLEWFSRLLQSAAGATAVA